jgi:hypothetical protein
VTPDYPSEGYGPSEFPAEIDPLTGLEVDNPKILSRRPVIIKVSNLPRSVRPQWGLSFADIVYEYYTEEGSTRYAAIFYGRDAEQVGPIRSARFFDDHLIRMYKGIFAYGSADRRVNNRLFGAEYASRLMLEWLVACPAMCRFEPKGANYLVADSAVLSSAATKKGISNTRQDLKGMLFQYQIPPKGTPVEQVVVRYSAAIQNRWDYDPASGRYLRSSETKDDFTNGQGETFASLTDRLNNERIGAENVVVLFVPYSYYKRTPEMVEINLLGNGAAYALRDGQLFQLTWQRTDKKSIFTLTYPDGTPYPYKPGVTWYEVMGTSTKIVQQGTDWRFVFGIP